MANFCSNCGRPSADSAYCSTCGAAQRHPEVSSSSGKSGSAVGITAVIAGAVVVVAGLVVAALVLLGGQQSDDQPDLASSEGPATESMSTSTSTPPARNAKRVEGASADDTAASPGDVRDLPAGLFCRDLMAKSYSYVAAVDYWRMHGQPNQMDEDRNGIPCQTVYSPEDVSAYWGENAVPQEVVDSVSSLPPGMFCRDLFAGGYSYSQAVDYWYTAGVPDRMDEDLNGIPCETVYSTTDVSLYWYG